MSSSITLRALAKRAGVSVTTISLALRNHPRISPKVRARIQRIAAESGYRRNPLVSHLFAELRAGKASRYASTLGFLAVDLGAGALENVQAFQKFVRGARKQCEHLGYKLDVLEVNSLEITPKRLYAILRARGIQGVLVVPSKNIFTPEFDPIWDNLAAVVLGIRPHRPALHFVYNDHFSSAQIVVEKLLMLGYRRPLLLLPDWWEDALESRFRGGFIVGQQALPVKDRLEVVVYANNAEGCNAFKNLREKFRPDVLITLGAEGAEWAKTLGIKVPEEIALAQLDCDGPSKGAGIDQINLHVGRVAVDVVVGMIQRGEFSIPKVQQGATISGNWVDFPSCPLLVNAKLKTGLR